VNAPSRVIVEADGGSRGNPGPAGYGAVVYDVDHETVLAERSEYLGVATNNVAEYRGLIAGLSAAAELDAHSVDVRMDSKLVVEQMSGRWKIKHPDMIPLAAQARALAERFGYVSYTWIPRDRNARADRLANEAMDAGRDAPARAAARPATTGPGWTGATGRATRLILLRHGQTELSVDRRYSGRGNPALTDLGREQARRAAGRLAGVPDVAAVLSSPLDRAAATAQAVAAKLGLPVSVADGLIETDFGSWEGLTFAEAAARDPRAHARWLADPAVPAPGGESFDDVAVRVGAFTERVIADHPAQTVLVVSHVTPIKTILRLALDTGPSVLFRLHLDLASVSIADFYPDGLSAVHLVNDTSHLA
jgi:probable phosphoglycerate mutase